MGATTRTTREPKVFNSQQAAHLAVSLNTRIGIATGECVIARIGSADRREVTILGDTVNVASRLQSSAPAGGIAIDETTYLAIGMPLVFSGRDASIKGKGLTRIYTLEPKDIQPDKEHSLADVQK
jgi:class 3 adenylate cyclase